MRCMGVRNALLHNNERDLYMRFIIGFARITGFWVKFGMHSLGIGSLYVYADAVYIKIVNINSVSCYTSCKQYI